MLSTEESTTPNPPSASHLDEGKREREGDFYLAANRKCTVCSRCSPRATLAPHPPTPRGYEKAAASAPLRVAALGLPPERLDPVGEDDDGRDEDDDEHEHEDDGEQAQDDVVVPRLRPLFRRGAGASVREPEALLGEGRAGRV